MPDRFILTHIRRLPVFRDLPPAMLELIAGAVSVYNFDVGEYIYRQGEVSRGLYVFVAGQAVLTQTGPDGLERQVGAISTNQYVNEDALLRPRTETVSLRAISPVTLLLVDRQRLLTIIDHHPELRPYLGLPPVNRRTASGERAFRGQRETERILLVTRRHWWAWVRYAWFAIIVLVILVIIALSIENGLLKTALLGVAIIFPGLYALYQYIEWRNDTVIITDQRLMRVEHQILSFKESRAVITLDSIQETNTIVPDYDLFARLFNYGTIEIKTAGEAGNMVLPMIPNPEGVQDLIIEDRARHEQQHEQHELNRISAEIDRALGFDDAPAPPPQPDDAPRPTKGGFRFPAPMRYVTPDGDVVYRKHYALWFRQIAAPLLFMLLMIAAIFLPALIPSLSAYGIISVMGIGGFILSAIWFYIADWDWRNDLYIVSDDTITIIHKRPLWLRNEDDRILLSRVDNVGYDKEGFWRSLFNYGDVRISLIGADEHKVFYAVANPHEVQSEILRRQARAQRKIAEAEERSRREEFSKYMQVYHQKMSGAAPQTASAPPPPSYQPTPPQPHTPSAPAGDRPPNVPSRRQSDNMPRPSPYGRDGGAGRSSNRPSNLSGRPPNVPRRREDR